MKAMTTCLAILVLALGAVGACSVTKEKGAAEIEGSIKLAAQPDGSGDNCGLPHRVGENSYKLDNTDPFYCRRDRLNYFRLENFRSATEFSLEDDYCDDNSSQWSFKLRTYIEPVSTGWISIASLKAANEGEIVTRGVILVEKMVKGGDQIDELSCVRIWGSQPGKSN